MKWNSTLTWIAVIYTLITALFIWNSPTLTGGTAIIYVLIFPAFWIISAIILTIWSIRKRKTWFERKMIFSTLFLLLFCTPIPLYLFYKATEPEIVRSSTHFFTVKSQIYKSETFVYYDDYKKARIEFWVSKPGSEDVYLRDSVWVYFNREGDTLKTEEYENDTLVRTIERKKN